MKQTLLLILTLAILNSKALGQEFNKSTNRDSLLQTIIKTLPENKRTEILNAYNSGSDQEKEFLLVILSMPRSSKNEMIKNIDLNFRKINYLKTAYLKLVPKNYRVSIEFNPIDKIANTKETIDLSIIYNYNNETFTTQEWNLDYNSKKLKKMLRTLNWSNQTLKTIKKLLIDANCVSIENDQPTTVGFARSGLGKYSYILFDKDLTNKQIKQYNNGCQYLFFKNNIVLEYEGGAAGPQCFPD